jgi:hypothetical protein
MSDPRYALYLVVGEHKTYRFGICSVCSSLILSTDQFKHTRWHRDLEQGQERLPTLYGDTHGSSD